MTFLNPPPTKGQNFLHAENSFHCMPKIHGNFDIFFFGQKLPNSILGRFWESKISARRFALRWVKNRPLRLQCCSGGGGCRGVQTPPALISNLLPSFALPPPLILKNREDFLHPDEAGKVHVSRTGCLFLSGRFLSYCSRSHAVRLPRSLRCIF